MSLLGKGQEGQGVLTGLRYNGNCSSTDSKAKAHAKRLAKNRTALLKSEMAHLHLRVEPPKINRRKAVEPTETTHERIEGQIVDIYFYGPHMMLSVQAADERLNGVIPSYDTGEWSPKKGVRVRVDVYHHVAIHHPRLRGKLYFAVAARGSTTN